MKRTFSIILTVACLVPSLLRAQSLKAEISPMEIFIGEQAEAVLTVDGAGNRTIGWPRLEPRQQIVPGVEVLSVAKDGASTLRIRLTSFDGDLYHLPPFKVTVGGDTLRSGDLALKVSEVEVDTTQLNTICPPKDVMDNPFLWDEWAPSFWLSILLLLLIAVGSYLLLRLRDNKPVIARIKIIRRLLPHQKAMQAIEQIKADKMSVQDDQKEYYTRLTETLRRYIEERYGFSAMEMTSSEIIERLTASASDQDLDELRQLFVTADLVKFAKYSVLTNENDANLVSAIDFINQTKQENLPAEETVRPQLTATEQRSQKERRLLKGLIWTVAAVSLLLLCYIVYSVYLLLM